MPRCMQVKVAEGALYPTLSVQGNVQQALQSSLLQLKTFNASVIGQLACRSIRAARNIR